MSIEKANVVTFLQQKTEDGYENPTYFSVEQRFVGPIRGGSEHLHNFEEQYLLGTDTYTVESSNSDGDTIFTKSFCSEHPNTSEGFYQIVTTKYKKPKRYGEGESGAIYHFEGDSLIIPRDGNASFVGNALQCADSTIYEYSDNTLKIYPNYYMVTQTDKLYYIKSNNVVNPSESEKAYVLTKDTIDRINTKEETITREIIFNEEGD